MKFFCTSSQVIKNPIAFSYFVINSMYFLLKSTDDNILMILIVKTSNANTVFDIFQRKINDIRYFKT